MRLPFYDQVHVGTSLLLDPKETTTTTKAKRARAPPRATRSGGEGRRRRWRSGVGGRILEGGGGVGDEAVPRGAAAAVGEVGGGDPALTESSAGVARHLRLRRGCRLRLRPRRLQAARRVRDGGRSRGVSAPGRRRAAGGRRRS